MVIFHSYVNVYQRVPEKMMENVGLMENEGLDQTNRGNAGIHQHTLGLTNQK